MILGSIFHLLLMLYMFGYIFVYQSSKYYHILKDDIGVLQNMRGYPPLCYGYHIHGDVLYYTITFVTILSWFIFNGNCILTIVDSNNKPDKFDIYDVHQLLPFLSEFQMRIFVNFVICGTIVNLIFIHLRSHLLPTYVLVGFIAIYVIYLLYIRHFYNENIYNQLHIDTTKENWLTFVSSVYIIYCLFLLYL